MRKILITGFQPFGGRSVNSSWEVVRRLPAVIGDLTVSTRQIPVSFESDAEEVLREADAVRPDIILCLGQAAKRPAITPEQVAINLRHSDVPDPHGYEPHDEPIIPGGPDAYFSTLPARQMAEAMEASGVPAEVSYSAGTFVCNDLMYKLLHRYHNTDTAVGFIHVPLLSGPDSPAPAGIRIEDAVKAVTAAIKTL